MLQKIRSSALPALLVLAMSSWFSALGQSRLKHEPNLTEQQKIDFLLHARVIASKQTNKGITNPLRYRDHCGAPSNQRRAL